MSNNIAGKVVVITGASSGLGEAAARRCPAVLAGQAAPCRTDGGAALAVWASTSEDPQQIHISFARLDTED
jgi:NAD(P)-dependent dehydrogenase (short-subunit alcohol dehydrogenase family)